MQVMVGRDDAPSRIIATAELHDLLLAQGCVLVGADQVRVCMLSCVVAGRRSVAGIGHLQWLLVMPSCLHSLRRHPSHHK